MSNNLDLLFPRMEIVDCEIFQVTRNANTEPDEEDAEDLLAMIESRCANATSPPSCASPCSTTWTASGGACWPPSSASTRTRTSSNPAACSGHARSVRAVIAGDSGATRPGSSSRHPCEPAKRDASIFYVIRDAGSILLQHPYESFATSVEWFVKEASRDPKVRAIKMTLYRTSKGHAHRRISDRRGPQWQAGGGGRGAAGALRRGGEYALGGPPGTGRHPCHLRRHGPQDPLQAHPGRAPRLRRLRLLCAHRHRQLSRGHRAALR